VTFRNTVALQLAIGLLTVLFTVIAVLNMPSVIPTHWGIDGKPDAYGSRNTMLWMGVGLGMLTPILTILLPIISPKEKPIRTGDAAFLKLMTLVSFLMSAMVVIIINAAMGPAADPTRPIFAVLGLVFAAMGPIMADLKPNFYAGIRTPWTLSSDAVWRETHRRAGKIFLFGGIATLAFAILTPWPIIGVVAILAVSFGTIIDSYFVYRRMS